MSGMKPNGDKRKEIKRAMLLADLGLILALLIVLYALSQRWVEPEREEDTGSAPWACALCAGAEPAAL